MRKRFFWLNRHGFGFRFHWFELQFYYYGPKFIEKFEEEDIEER